MKRIFHLNTFVITLGLTVLVLFLFLIGVPILDLIELKTYDLRFRSRGLQKASPEIVMAVIDEKSLDMEGRWPWPRSRIATLAEILSEDGAKVIGFDVGFLEPDENTNLRFIDHLNEEIRALGINDPNLGEFIREKRAGADNDLTLAEAMRNSRAQEILGYFFHMDQGGLEYLIEEDEIEKQIRRIRGSKYPLVRYEKQEMGVEPFVEAYAPEANLDRLTDATEGSGYFNMFTDEDGVVRWMPLIIRCREELYGPLSIQCVWRYLDRPQLMVKVASYGVEGVQMGKVFIPTNVIGQMLINYLGPPKTFPHYSIGEILAGKTPKGTFKDKIVLVGATAIGIYDMRNTPFSAVYPGLEIHATVIDNILRQRFMNEPQWNKIYTATAILLLGFLTGLALPRLGAVQGMLFALGLFVLYILIGLWLFMSYGLWVNLVYPLLTLVLAYTSLTVYRYMTEERERKKIRGAFSYYVSSSVVNEMLKNPDKLKLGGDKKELSVLFSDIRGFTTISEGLTPEDLVHLLNEYLTVMTDIVFKYDGTLDKYIGDALMAVYGAPLEQPDHPIRACHSALDMMDGLKGLNEKWILEGKKPLDIGIGINTGMMMVGNMGSDQRFDYTVMGDAVNLGSRLEGANKNYRTHILISDSTHEKVKREFTCMELDSVRVKGKTEPVRIFELVGPKGVDADHRMAIDYFHKGLQLYKKQRWDDAVEVFGTVTAMNSSIYTAEIYIQRCRDLKANPPPKDWDGVFTMTTK